jgi:type III secretion protein V
MLKRFFSSFSNAGREIRAGNLQGVLMQSSDLLLVACLALVVGLMIVPLPTFLLDIFITLNITIATTILMVSLYISNGAQMASFPTILLLTTLYRLSLEVSATRLILLQADAGDVIKAFGEFVVGGNFVVGAVIFLIITLVQFLVITKGSERVAEVAARFTLDAMPGKQMSIDADLRAGSIDFKTAHERRQMLAKESQFYGAMDGAMKFVKGDAMAGIIITLINIIGGLIIGVAMNGMPFGEAIETYSILTIGDGLVAQIPALLISISAGMVVTRVASEDGDTNLGSDIAGSFLAQPKAIGVVSVILLLLGAVPGMPKVAFLLLAAITGGLSYGLFAAKRIREKAKAGSAEGAIQVIPPQAPNLQLAKTFPLIFEVGGDLAPLVSLATPQGQAFFDKLVKLRDSLYRQIGVVYPPLRVDQVKLAFEEENNYRFWLNEVPLSTGRIRSDCVMVNASAQQLSEYGIQAEETVNPADYKPASWVDRSDRERTAALDVKVWDTDEVLLLNISAFLRTNAADFLTIQEVQWMVTGLRKLYPALVDEVLPKIVNLQQLTEILQRLLSERVPVRDLRAILQAISEWNRVDAGNVVALVEHARLAMKRRICFGLSNGKQRLIVYQLDPAIEDMIRDAIRQGPAGEFLALEQEQSETLFNALRSQLGNVPTRTQNPVLVVDGSVRRFVKPALGGSFPQLHVLSYGELAAEITVEPVGVISLDAPPEEEPLALAQGAEES